ncbi:hypothetical protein D3C83_111910 [compost metagenome]
MPDGDGRGRIDVLEPLGAVTLVHIRAEAAPEQLIRVVVPADAEVRVADDVGFRLRRDRLHLFRETQRLS